MLSVMIYTFGDYELVLSRRKLRRNGVQCWLEPQVFDVLAYVLQHRGRMVTKDQRCWS